MKKTYFTFFYFISSLILTALFFQENQMDLSLFGTQSESHLQASSFILNLSDFNFTTALFCFFVSLHSFQLILNLFVMIPNTYIYELKFGFKKTVFFFISTHLALLIGIYLIKMQSFIPYPNIYWGPYFTGVFLIYINWKKKCNSLFWTALYSCLLFISFRI